MSDLEFDELVLEDVEIVEPAKPGDNTGYAGLDKDDLSIPPTNSVKQWATQDGNSFHPTFLTEKELPPGLYDIKFDNRTGQFYFERIKIKTESLVKFPHTNSELIVNEIAKFWDQAEMFKAYGLTHKRGIMLWGPPGSGKSSLIQLLISDVVERNGIAIRWGSAPILITEGMRVLRAIQPKTPVVIIMEDIDSILEQQSESHVLNILDGVEMVSHTVFLASTNYPEKLGARIINRPSRFDKRFKIGHPTSESRLIYLKHLLKDQDIGINGQILEDELAQWVSDTEGFSFAHLRELFIAVIILGDKYQTALKTLSGMKEKVKADEGGPLGFK